MYLKSTLWPSGVYSRYASLLQHSKLFKGYGKGGKKCG